MRDSVHIIELIEYETKSLDDNELPECMGNIIYDKYSNQITIELLPYKTRHRWKITANGWVGYIPLSPALGLTLRPKVPIRNLFLMWKYAYNLKSFKFLHDITESNTLEGFYEQLAGILADKALNRSREGLYRSYNAKTEELPYVTGTIDVGCMIRKPWNVNIRCTYYEHTADIVENQILAWTLHKIARSSLCTERVSTSIRAAYRHLQGVVALKPFSYKDCIDRLYNRLNQDYESIHALCRFFLEHSGPSLDKGDCGMVPFLVNMSKLYELFVREWLRNKLPPNLELRAPYNVNIGEPRQFSLIIDLVIYDKNSGGAAYILDTKYKNPKNPSQADINQVVTYALAKSSKEAILVYPAKTSFHLDATIGGIHVRSLSFDIGEDIEEAGQSFLSKLLSSK